MRCERHWWIRCCVLPKSETLSRSSEERHLRLSENALWWQIQRGLRTLLDSASDDFVLAYPGNPPSTFNVRGDAVGCLWRVKGSSDMSLNTAGAHA